MQVTLGGQVVDQFTVTPTERLLQKIKLSAAQMGAAEMAELRVLVEVDADRHGAAVIAATLEQLRRELRLACGIRVEAAAVGAGTLPRFELKARRVVHVE